MTDKIYDEKIERFKRCTDEMINALRECTEELLADKLNIDKYDKINNQLIYFCDEILPYTNIVRQVASELKQIKKEVISSKVIQ